MPKTVIVLTKVQNAAIAGAAERVQRAQVALAQANAAASEIAADIVAEHELPKIPDGVRISQGTQDGRPTLEWGQDEAPAAPTNGNGKKAKILKAPAPAPKNGESKGEPKLVPGTGGQIPEPELEPAAKE